MSKLGPLFSKLRAKQRLIRVQAKGKQRDEIQVKSKIRALIVKIINLADLTQIKIVVGAAREHLQPHLRPKPINGR